MRFAPWDEIRPLLESGGRIVSFSLTREWAEDGPLTDSHLEVWMPDGAAIHFRPGEFALERAQSLVRAYG